jgi:two-component system, sensor histidine kinase and response regulator
VEQAKFSVLIVDDQPSSYDVLDLFLAQEPYRLGYESSGEKLLLRLESLRQNLPDAILLDMILEGMSGLEACETIKQHPNWSHIPIIMMTAANTKDELTQCFAAGADDFLSKPINRLELKARLRARLRDKQQCDELKAALQLREEMATMIIHDLRAPATTVSLSAKRLLNPELSPEKQRSAIDRILRVSCTQEDLLNDLLITAKFEAGQLSLQRTPVDLSELMAEICIDYEEIAAQRYIHLVQTIPAVNPVQSLDRRLIQRVIENLLTNAIRYSPKYSIITLQLEYPTSDTVHIQVLDQGRGIKPDLKARFFERFTIGEPQPNILQMGLGLSFCKMVVELHQGQIEIEDNSPMGTIFTVKLANQGFT